MNVNEAIAHILKEEGVEYLFAYPLNPIIESAAEVGIRPIVVRQERVGLHMADAISRTTSRNSVGVFCMQSGPGAENAFPGVAQAYADSVPIVVLPLGKDRGSTEHGPNFNASHNYREITKSAEQASSPDAVPDALRRAFSGARNGRPRPTLVEIPRDLFSAELSTPITHEATRTTRSAPDSHAVGKAADILLDAEDPVIYAGQGVHYAEAWDDLRTFAELLEAPVTTSLEGKSAFPEDHPLSLGTGGRTMPRTVPHFLDKADLIFGIGCSFAKTAFGVTIPTDNTIVHATLDPADVNSDVPADLAMIGDASLTLQALNEELGAKLEGEQRGRFDPVTDEIDKVYEEWMDEWKPLLTSDDVPLSPYRVIADLMDTVDRSNTIITHDAGSPRDELSPFWETTAPLTYIGWGKSTQLGYGLGLAMGAKLAHPEKLCINVWGDAAIGMTGMDFETAAREEIPILSILFNNFSMAMEIEHMPVSTERYDSTDISGHYADVAEALGGYGERVETPEAIVPAIERGIQQTEDGVPALLEFITTTEKVYSNEGAYLE